MEERKGSYAHRKEDLKRRLSRIEGQVRGIGRMVDDEKYCVDVLTQVAAIRAALDRVAVAVLEEHVQGCIGDGSQETSERLEELVHVVERFVSLKG